MQMPLLSHLLGGGGSCDYRFAKPFVLSLSKGSLIIALLLFPCVVYADLTFPKVPKHAAYAVVKEGGDVGKKEGDDYPARLYITFEYDPDKVSFYRKLQYKAGAPSSATSPSPP